MAEHRETTASPQLESEALGSPLLGFVKPLDGVRALAVLAVMGTHTGLMGFSGGSAGVDIFFVLSGFLITTLLLEEVDSYGRIYLGRFYARRALRLFPALFTMLAVLAAYAMFVVNPDQRKALLREVFFAGTYLYNFASTQEIYLGHTWSLALEEQFYLIWPLVLLACIRIRGERLLLIVTLGIVAFVASGRLAGVADPYSFYSERPDALLIGCAAAMLRRRGVHFGPWPGLTFTTAVSIGILVLAVSTQGWLGRTAGLSVVAAAAAVLTLSLVAQPKSVPGRLLSARPLLEVGKRSYGIYIWHLPIFRWFADQNFNIPDSVSVLLKYAATFAVAWISFRFIEAPALRLKTRLRAPASPFAGVSSGNSRAADNALSSSHQDPPRS